MSTVQEKLAANVFLWEGRGRGTLTYEQPVGPDPPFVPFPGHRLFASPSAPIDHGHRPTFLSKMVDRLSSTFQPSPGTGLALRGKIEPDEEPEPNWQSEEALPMQELRILLPPDMSISVEAMEHFLSSVSLAAYPLTLELIGEAGMVWIQLALHPDDLSLVSAQVRAHFPEIVTRISEENLTNTWGPLDDDFERLVIEFALAYPFMMPLGNPGKSDLFVGLIGALSSLEAKEAGIYQVTFTPLSEPWAENIVAAVTRPDGKPFFDDGADLVKAAKEKTSQMLYEWWFVSQPRRWTWIGSGKSCAGLRLPCDFLPDWEAMN